jgi:hypothetical protein
MSLRGRWRIRSVSFFVIGMFGQKHFPRHARVHRAVCVFPYLLHFSGYCKANDTRRLILDVANASLAAYAFQSTQPFCRPSFTLTLLVALTITRLTIIDICYLLLLNLNLPSGLLSLSLTTYAYGILHSALFCSSQKQKDG